jgi:hypothetical protein|tara:strand:- start:536 stop:1537 length:1002 start_codon:yes stop_codon:yes gene_type:complete|mmetsp:Transcript_4051/g.13549  ORF Transcript_4051/g.13549 Transcript_4051/m.13549 type:complete len:334 (+) Transcript_4051:1240-2241(+)
MADHATTEGPDTAGTSTAAPVKGRLGNCVVCDAGVVAKYKCPGCGIATCSLVCVKKHKQTGDGCSGKRKVGEFKDIREFTDADLVSDYRFLEDALLEKDRAKRWRPTFKVGTETAARADRSPANSKTVDLLTRAASDRGTQLFCMPDGMQRRVANTTFYDRKRNLMQWRVEWLFHNSRGEANETETESDLTSEKDASKKSKQPASAARAEDAKVDETRILETAMRNHLVSGPGNAVRMHELRRLVLIDRETERKKAAGGRDAESEKQSGAEKSIGVFLPAEGHPANDKRYHKLDPSSTLRECLKGKRVLEFPTLHVAVLPDDSEFFPLVEDGE